MDTTGVLPSNLAKLTIPQLKALCKERKITGYSKLSKPELLLKLGTTESSKITAALDETHISKDRPADASAVRVINTSSSGSSDHEIAAVNQPQGPAIVSGINAEKRTQPVQLPSVAQTPSEIQLIHQPQDTNSILTRKRPLKSLQSSPELPSNKKQKTSAISSITSQTSNFASSFNISETLKLNSKPSKLGLVPISKAASPTQTPIRTHAATFGSSSSISTPLEAMKLGLSLQKSFLVPRIINTGDVTTKMLPTTKRFKPLVTKKYPPKPNETVLSASASKLQQSNSLVPLYHLDFPLARIDTIDLKPITLPPKLCQRKFLHRWSIILSALPNAEKKQCCLVSRMFRYAVFLSAAWILESKFSGRRWSQLTLKYASNVTNFWPYLRLRELEVESRMRHFENSFLGRYFKDLRPIERRLWNSQDNENQLTVAIRFVMSRLWFLISVGGGGGSSTWPGTTVEDAQEIVKGEIWSITTRTPLPHSAAPNQIRKEIFYVLEQTCEVIGHSTAPAYLIEPSESELEAGGNLRADWSAYIDCRQLPTGAHTSPPPPLLANLRWQNQEEHYRGLSKLWIKKIAGEADSGVVKKTVAERYVLACVVGNSISGQWMSSVQMEQDFAGKPDLTLPTMKSKVQQIHLFLPEHHHVESLHFTTANGKPLHSALAIVQTTSREYYILRDNGMQVGTQEDGVSGIWMEILGCTNLGRSVE